VNLAADDDGRRSVYVRLPFSGELVAALEEHAANLGALLDLAKRAEVSGSELVDVCTRAATAVARDVARVRRARRRRR
jgi:c-di-GMP-related signal transduction protein